MGDAMIPNETKEKYLHLALQTRQQGECPITLAQKMIDFVCPPQGVEKIPTIMEIAAEKAKKNTVIRTVTVTEKSDEADLGENKSSRGWRRRIDDSFKIFDAERNAEKKSRSDDEPQGRKFKGFDTPAGAIPTPENTGLAAGQLSVLVTICDLMDRAGDNEGIRGCQIAERMNVHPANLQDPITALIKKEFLKAEGEKKTKRYFALKRPDGSEYKGCEVIIEDGVRIKRCPPRPATDGVGFMEFGS